ncbi:tetratricopeptide repeat protein [Erythrobacter sp. sf7]|uniref:Tetratricopeptide repeat protein n=2 Tax=Erythrobacter fulvus TaxID=2987523 RepID=A0ABT5JPW1_9SPHN|nr:tetratricopeptide repeat protein [Erythrobacter fulvus]MDC8754816.1 tetratricopeptide repeat protein [Erythrobacter fulvus]
MMLALVSGGCSSLDFGPKPRMAQNVQLDRYFVSRLAAGRQYLNQGQVTKAIEAFRQASYNEATAPEALNGMGVAYSMLGRDDVARDLFVRAIDRNPADERFWRNLARADEKIMMAAKRQPAPADVVPETIAAPAEPQLAAMDTPLQPAVAKPVKARTLKKAKVTEVFISTKDSDQVAAAGVPATGNVVVVGKRAAPLRVASRSSSPQYPIRIRLKSSDKAGKSSAFQRDGQNYPIRISLTKQ